jgi:hypothetical protein
LPAEFQEVDVLVNNAGLALGLWKPKNSDFRLDALICFTTNKPTNRYFESIWNRFGPTDYNVGYQRQR